MTSAFLGSLRKQLFDLVNEAGELGEEGERLKASAVWLKIGALAARIRA